MSDNKIHLSSSPHFTEDLSTQKIMFAVIFSMIPECIAGIYFFGIPALIRILAAVASCVAFEAMFQMITKDKIRISNLSAVVSGILLALVIPSTTPLWMVVLGSLIAMVVAKGLFGGIGSNVFNPALTGRIFLLIAYPVQMTDWTTGVPDALSGSTMLADVKYAPELVSSLNFTEMLGGVMNGSMGEISAIALILGGLYLLWRKVISWHIPVSILATMAIFAASVGASYGGAMIYEFPLFHILAGGALLGAIYMATDYSTSPMTHRGMIIYGVGIGLLTMIIRLWGAYPEGMSFAIFIMNAATPLINKYVRPKRFGTK